jgi:hypothetical protein
MSTLQLATDVLRAAEDQLRELIAQAAAQGEYDMLPVLAGWAKQLRAIFDVAEAVPTTPALLQHHDGDGANGVAALPVEHPQAPGVPRGAQTSSTRGGPAGRRRKKPGSRKSKVRRRGKTAKKDYPQFLLEGDTLVKVGWSKSDSRTYEHRAPRRVIDLLVAAITRAGTGGQRFTMEHLLPLRDPKEEADVPDYQTYLVLAWLRKEDLIIQHGRQGYSLPADANLAGACQQRWKQLTQR